MQITTYYRQGDEKEGDRGHIFAFQNEDEDPVVGEEKCVYCTECGLILKAMVIELKPNGVVRLDIDFPKTDCPGRNEDLAKTVEKELVCV